MGQLLLYKALLGPLTKWGPGQNAPVTPHSSVALTNQQPLCDLAGPVTIEAHNS